MLGPRLFNEYKTQISNDTTIYDDTVITLGFTVYI